MADPFIGEIKLVGWSWAPKDYAQCDGATIEIMQNQALYSLIGTTYGGDGVNTFKLPDMRGRTPVGIHATNSQYTRGFKGGDEAVPLTKTQIAGHRHYAKGSSQEGSRRAPSDTSCFGTSMDPDDKVYGEATDLTAMKSDMISSTGGGQAHTNMQPSLAINFCIALTGVYPSRP
jgi:microcystin-dependent protein